MYASFLHVHRTGAATGSIGYAAYRNLIGEKVFFGWYNPWWGKNYFGVEVLAEGNFPKNPYKSTYQCRDMKTSDPEDRSIEASGELLEDRTTIKLFIKGIYDRLSLINCFDNYLPNTSRSKLKNSQILTKKYYISPRLSF